MTSAKVSGQKSTRQCLPSWDLKSSRTDRTLNRKDTTGHMANSGWFLGNQERLLGGEGGTWQVRESCLPEMWVSAHPHPLPQAVSGESHGPGSSRLPSAVVSKKKKRRPALRDASGVLLEQFWEQNLQPTRMCLHTFTQGHCAVFILRKLKALLKLQSTMIPKEYFVSSHMLLIKTKM